MADKVFLTPAAANAVKETIGKVKNQPSLLGGGGNNYSDQGQRTLPFEITSAEWTDDSATGQKVVKGKMLALFLNPETNKQEWQVIEEFPEQDIFCCSGNPTFSTGQKIYCTYRGRWEIASILDGWRFVNNHASEAVPANGVIAVTTTINGVIQGTKPSTTFTRFYAVNSAAEVPAGEYGTCYTSGVHQVAYDTGTPAFGQCYGPKPGQWTASKFYPGMTCLGTAANGVITCNLEFPLNRLIGKLNGSLAAGGTASVSLWYGGSNGKNADSTLDLTADDFILTSGSVASGKKVVCEWINGLWLITQAEC